MATRGFEFAYMLDGSKSTPVIRDFTLGAAAAHKVGDLMLMQSDGYIDQVTGTTTEVTCVMQEAVAAAAITLSRWDGFSGAGVGWGSERWLLATCVAACCVKLAGGTETATEGSFAAGAA